MSTGKCICFAHGKESGPWGSKIRYLAEIARREGWRVLSPDFQASRDFNERLDQLVRLAPAGDPLLLCGSSMGGYVCAHACGPLRPAGLFLMAPALYYPGYDREPADCPTDTVVVHGWQDDVVPVETALRFARPRGARLHLVPDGHRLTSTLPLLGQLLRAQLRRCAA